MTDRSASHVSFAIDRAYAAAPARVFAAWADPTLKARWFSCHGDAGADGFDMDFRVGGREVHRVGPPGGPLYTTDATYHDIVPGQRIVYGYTMHADARLVSVSLATVEIHADGAGSRLVLTEQSVFLDGYTDAAGREAGTRSGLDRLEAALAVEAALA